MLRCLHLLLSPTVTNCWGQANGSIVSTNDHDDVDVDFEVDCRRERESDNESKLQISVGKRIPICLLPSELNEQAPGRHRQVHKT